MSADGFLPASELLLHTEEFCRRVSSIADDIVIDTDRQELVSKLLQARALLSELQTSFNEDLLDIGRARTVELFRCLLLILHWCAFYSRRVIDRSTFRRLMMIQAGFTLLLAKQLPPRSGEEAS